MDTNDSLEKEQSPDGNGIEPDRNTPVKRRPGTKEGCLEKYMEPLDR
jgi:hypothetical protein